jgi:iron complex transport system ATP-binding protein
MPHRGTNGVDGDADRAAVASALAAVDATGLSKRMISELSGGERARILIARALAQDARIFIADEPVAGLDPSHTLTLFEHLTKIAADGRAVIVALHDLSLALRYCHRAVLLRDGRIAASGPVGDVLSERNIAAVYGVRAVQTRVDGVPVIVPLSPVT